MLRVVGAMASLASGVASRDSARATASLVLEKIQGIGIMATVRRCFGSVMELIERIRECSV
jgi:hypothetical protein